MKFPDLPFAVLDTETTGFVPRVHHIIEFASVRYEGGRSVDAFEQLLSVKEQIPPHVEVLTRIRQADIANKPTMDDVRGDIVKHLGEDTLLIGQNLAFDLSILKGEDIELTSRPWVDTSLLASLVFPEFRSYSLAYMSTALKLDHEPKHRAMGDVRATTELFGHIWERLLELPEEQRLEAVAAFEHAAPGYKWLFGALPKSKSKKAAWIGKLPPREAAKDDRAITMPEPEAGTTALREEALDPGTLQQLLNGAAEEKKHCIIAVKNLEASLKRLQIPEGVSVTHATWLLLNSVAGEALLQQKERTAEEALLALKLAWWKPRTRNDLPIHGGEVDVWNGKLACTDTSRAYADQFSHTAPVVLLDHRQLLDLVSDSAHPGHAMLDNKPHIIIDDASMLEDTATKAFGHFCSLDYLRAAAQGNADLMMLTDVLSILFDKLRGGEDQYQLNDANLQRTEAKGVVTQIGNMLTDEGLNPKTRELLLNLSALLSPQLLDTHIIWIEHRINGSLSIASAPRRLDQLLDEHLFSRFPTTLLIPRGLENAPPCILPRERKTTTVPLATHDTTVSVTFPAEQTYRTFLEDPPKGKTVLLMGSKRLIEQAYIDHAERLEARGVTMICQGLSGGQGRMESEFLAAEGDALWLLTPWMFEGMDLPPNTIDHLLLDQLPFDHPGNPVFTARKQQVKDSFSDYALPRLECRLFRLLRAFCRQRSADGNMIVLDQRMKEKSYGPRIRGYLQQFGEGTAENPEPSTTQKKKEGPGEAKNGQPSLFS